MDQKLKERLVGATVISALAVIFVPMLFEENIEGETAVAEIKIPNYPGAKQLKTDSIGSAPKSENTIKIDKTVGKLVDDEKLPEVISLPLETGYGSPPGGAPPESVVESEIEPGSSAIRESVEKDAGGYVVSESRSKTDAIAENDVSETESAPNAGLSAWMIQVGSFELEENANEMRDMLRNEGFSAFVEAVESEKENFFRVRVGPEIDRQRAEMKLELMQKRFGLKGMIVSYPGRT